MRRREMCQGILTKHNRIQVVNWKVSSEDELDDLIETLNGCRGAFYTEGEWIWHSVFKEGDPPLVNLTLHVEYFYHGERREFQTSSLFIDEENGCAMFLVMFDWDDLVMLEEYPTDVLIYTASERVSKATHGKVIFLRGVPADRHSGHRWEQMQKCTTTTIAEREAASNG
jgi:hypothetical protein